MKNNMVESHHLLSDNSPFAVREAFNHLRINLSYSVSNTEHCPIYAITSSSEDFGKSTIVSNLAVSFAQTEKKILLIDSDMRLPVQATSFGLSKNSVGLSEILSGILTDPMQAVQKTDYENLYLLTSGHVPPNPSELLEGKLFDMMLETFSKEFDVILIDFPPLEVVADALAVCKGVSGYLLVIRSGFSEIRKTQRAIEAIRKVDAKCLGVVLNDVNPKGKGTKKKYFKESSYSKYASKYAESAKRHKN